MLHVTNGDAAVPALRAAGAEGHVLPWRDVLHDGPVPAGLRQAELRGVRADFLADDCHVTERDVLRTFEERDARLDSAARAGEAITLWFEADRYDLLQLLQALDRLPEHGPLRLVLVGQDAWRSVTEVGPDELAALWRTAPTVTGEQRALALSAWAAFTAGDPAVLCEAARGTPALPAVGQALHRLLQEYPSTDDGLGRAERQLLEAFAFGAETREAAFAAAVRAEERPSSETARPGRRSTASLRSSKAANSAHAGEPSSAGGSCGIPPRSAGSEVSGCRPARRHGAGTPARGPSSSRAPPLAYWWVVCPESSPPPGRRPGRVERAQAKCTSAASSCSTGRSHVGHHQRTSTGVPHASCLGRSPLSRCRAPQSASSRSAPASSWPDEVSS